MWTLRLDFLPQSTQSCSQRTQSKLIKRNEGINKFGVMRFEKIGSVFPIIRNGANIKQDKVTDGYPITRIETIADGTVDLKRVGYASIHDERFSEFFFFEYDILMSHINSVSHLGKVALVNHIGEKVIHGMNLLCLKADESRINPMYSFYFLRSPIFRSKIKRITKKSVNQASFNISNLKDIEIPLPPLPDQLHIATILSKAENLIAQRKESMRLLDEFLKSTFLEMFGDPVRNEKGWKIDSLKNYGSLKNGLNYTRNESGLNIRCLGVGDFKDLSKLTDIDSLPILNLSSAPSDEYYLQDGDLVFVRSNGNRELVGRCLVVFPKKDKVTYSGFCIRYRIEKTQITSIYLSHLFRVSVFKKSMLQNGRGANIQNINQQILGSLKIPVPPISLQTQFAQIVEKTEALKSQYQQSLQELESLYGSLSQKAFRGELTSKQNSANP